jgi:hypothetical protein
MPPKERARTEDGKTKASEAGESTMGWIVGAGSAGRLGMAIVAIAATVSTSLGATDHLATPLTADRVAHETRVENEPPVDKLSAEPWRTHFGRTDVYIPTFFEPKNGTYDLIIHFHGLAAAQEANVERSGVNAAVASINIGVGSGPYEAAFKNAWVFPHLVTVIEKAIARSGRAHGAHLGRIALSAWSAGSGSVSAILRSPANVKRIDALMLADGLHSDYVNGKKHTVDDAPLQKYLKIADAAIKGDKLFALTHSSILTNGYPNTTETIGELIRLAGVEKEAVVEDGPREMEQVYEADRGDFHVKGYLGVGVKDHINHIWGMNETMLPYLRERWQR